VRGTNWFFGVSAVSADGAESPVASAVPAGAMCRRPRPSPELAIMPASGHRPAMAFGKQTPNGPDGLPTRQQVLDFIAASEEPAGKKDIARGFGLKGTEKIALKALLKDMAEEGLIDGNRSAFHRMGGVPEVTVLRVLDIEDGNRLAIPDSWQPDDGAPPPRIRIVEPRGKARGPNAALKVGDRVLARTEEAGRGLIAHPMKKLPTRTEQLLGVVEFDGARQTLACACGQACAQLCAYLRPGRCGGGPVGARRAGQQEPARGLKVTEVLGDPLAPRAFSLIAIHKHGIPCVFPQAALDEAAVAAKLALSEEAREDLRALPIMAIDPTDARDHDDAIWAEPDGEGGFRAVVAIADVSFYVRPGGTVDREARKRGNSVYFPDRVVPMLPQALSSDVCSLKVGADRAAMACHLNDRCRGADHCVALHPRAGADCRGDCL